MFSKRKRLFLLVLLLLVAAPFAVRSYKKHNWNPAHAVGDPIDTLNGVVVYYNGGVSHTGGRNVAPNGYNLGMRYQCVEFVKRYYYAYLHHEMPDSYGNAVDFFDPTLEDGQRNAARNLRQYTNGGSSKPRVNDLIVFSGTAFNAYGHVAIVSRVSDEEVEIVQQNPGPYGDSRVVFSLLHDGGSWRIDNEHLLGWLRK